MKICKLCGTQLSDDAKFCTTCGADTTKEGAVETDFEAAQRGNDQQGSYYQSPDASGQSGNYYQPGNEYSAPDSANFNQYQNPSYQPPVVNGKPAKKKKMPAWAIVLIVIACVVVLIIGSLVAVGIWGVNYLDKNPELLNQVESELSEEGLGIDSGTVDGSVYTNDSLNLKIDLTDSDFRFLNQTEISSLMGSDSAEYTEAYILNEKTSESVLIMKTLGSPTELHQDMNDFVRETADYIYSDTDTPVDISDTYTLAIGGETYTCIDVTLPGSDDYGGYNTINTMCFYRNGLTFFEIQITTFDDTQTTAQSLVEQFFTTIN